MILIEVLHLRCCILVCKGILVNGSERVYDSEFLKKKNPALVL